MTFSRMETSKSRLRIRWRNGPNPDRRVMGTPEEVLADLQRQSGNRPIMIQRQSDQRDPKVAKLLKAALKSERFSLASQWFHCIRVGDEVLQKSHPLHSYFKGRNPAALVLLSADAKKEVSFLGTTGQKVKWAPIASVLKASYKKNPTSAVKSLEKLLCTFDSLDGKKRELNAQLARAKKKNNKSKMASIEKKMEAEKKDRAKVFEQEAKLRELVLRVSADD